VRLHTTFIGGGPAGLAPLVWAARLGKLPRLAEHGLAIVEREQKLGSGTIGRYAITSDTLSETFIECLQDSADTELSALREHPATLEIAAHRGCGIPLSTAGAFLNALGDAMTCSIKAAGGHILVGYEAMQSQQCWEGSWLTRLRSPVGETELQSRNLVLATGAMETRAPLLELPVAGKPLLPRFSHKLMLSGEVLSNGGSEAVTRRLARTRGARVVIVGGSHSAVSAANVLLTKCGSIDFGRDAITLMHLRPLRVFYPSAADALADGYADFTTDDICPVSGRLFRLAGFRLESRELVMRVLGIGGRPPEPRLRLHRLVEQESYAVAQRLLEDADLIIAALGYRPNALPLLDIGGKVIPLPQPPSPLVDQYSRVLDINGVPVPGVFGIGLAAGFVPSGPLGGEPSFRGQTNGIRQWQNGVGAMIIDSLLT
jgi:hypothetical protein